MREVDKVVSMKEDVDAMSWGRVLEIGRQLQTEPSDGDRVALGRELVGIAQSNVLMRARLGIEDPLSDDRENRVMTSETEVRKDGLAEASAAFTEMLLSDGESEFELEFEPDEGPMFDQSLFQDHADQPSPEAASQPDRGGETPSPPDESETSNARPGLKRQSNRPGRFCNLYESRDGSLCVFEDEQGHLVAVDSSKLA